MSQYKIPISQSVAKLLEKTDQPHPGLLLDKLVRSVNHNLQPLDKGWQEMQNQHLKRVSMASNMEGERKALWLRYCKALDQLWRATQSSIFSMENTSPLSLHLSRDSSMENAGICLHPVYGVPIIPGSGLKGMSRALATQNGEERSLIERIFGSEDTKKDVHSGAIIFHDALPMSWPYLTVDIVNNHHGKYYDGKDAPGDWEEPNPVYFLTIEPGTQFSFALGKREPSIPDEDLQWAQKWLQSALTWLGAGAKTNAGYGVFKAIQSPETVQKPAFTAQYETELTLVSPAFFAGAMQDDSDCTLRSASLRGLLRWWWRSMHSGYLSVNELRILENSLFGSSAEGGALQIKVESKKIEKYQYDKWEEVKRIKNHSHPQTKDKKTTFGLYYLTYGMDENTKDKEGNRSRSQRWYCPENSYWKVTLSAKSVKNKNKNQILSAEQVLEQAKASLWLLCHYGGVGAKSRKGFGSFQELENGSLEDCKKQATQLRQTLNLNQSFSLSHAQSPSLHNCLPELEIETNYTNAFFAIHILGEAAQGFAQAKKHNLEKKALGLPRPRIGGTGGVSGKFNPIDTNKVDARKGRHSSPTLFHIARSSNVLTLRINFFIAPYLPDQETNKSFLLEYRAFLEKELREKIQTATQPQILSPPKQQQRPPSSVSKALPKSGEMVEAILLEEKTKKGGWRAKHEGSQLEGHIINSQDMPSDVVAGKRVTLKIHSINNKQISFHWENK